MFNIFKSINKVKTRRRVYISVLILTGVFLIFQRLDLLKIFGIEHADFDYLKPLILGAVSFILMYWVSEFKVKGERYITILGFPTVGVFVFSLFVELLITTVFGQIGYISFIVLSGSLIAFFSYILVLTSNIVNVASVKNIPLGQAGRAAYYVLNLIITYLLFLIVISNQLTLVLKISFVFFISFYIVFSTLWTINLRIGRRMAVSFVVGFLVSFMLLTLSIWPIGSVYMALILSIIIYITLGIALEVRERITRQVWLEYGLLLLLIFMIIITLSSWGINGTLI